MSLNDHVFAYHILMIVVSSGLFAWMYHLNFTESNVVAGTERLIKIEVSVYIINAVIDLLICATICTITYNKS